MTEETFMWLSIAGMLTAAAAMLTPAIRSAAGHRAEATTKPATPATASRGLTGAFDTLRRSHAARGHAIDALERQLRNTLRDDGGAVIETERVAAQTRQPHERIKELLDELVSSGALRRRYLALCPEGLGTSAEADTVSSLPERIDCERCSGVHAGYATRIEEVLVSTEELRRELASNGGGDDRPKH